jgi:hypothetical protein
MEIRMKPKQKTFIILATLALFLAVIFPPMRYVETVLNIPGGIRRSNPSPSDIVKFPEWVEQSERVEYSFIGTSTGDFLIARLLFEILGIVAVAGVAYYIVGKTPTDTPMKPSKKTPKVPWRCPKCDYVNSYWADKCQNWVKDSAGRKVLCLNPITPELPAEKKCPQCAEMVKYEAKICRFCRYEFDA